MGRKRARCTYGGSASPPDVTSVSSHVFAVIRYVQPWLGLVASMGVPRFGKRFVDSCYKAQAAWWGKVTLGEHDGRAVGGVLVHSPRAVDRFQYATPRPRWGLRRSGLGARRTADQLLSDRRST